jgi:hypothetical protein
MANPPGRPRVDLTDRSVVVSCTFPAREYDRLYRQATDARITIPELIRRALAPPPKSKNSRPAAPVR